MLGCINSFYWFNFVNVNQTIRNSVPYNAQWFFFWFGGFMALQDDFDDFPFFFDEYVLRVREKGNTTLNKSNKKTCYESIKSDSFYDLCQYAHRRCFIILAWKGTILCSYCTRFKTLFSYSLLQTNIANAYASFYIWFYTIRHKQNSTSVYKWTEQNAYFSALFRFFSSIFFTVCRCSRERLEFHASTRLREPKLRMRGILNEETTIVIFCTTSNILI